MLEYPVARPGLELDPQFAWLREHEPVAWMRFPGGYEGWLVTGYEDARRVLSDPVFTKYQGDGDGGPRGSTLTMLDAAEHAKVRRLLAGAFTRRTTERLRPRVQRTADDLLDAMAAAGPPADLVAALSFPLPVTVICELLGVPVEDRDRFAKWADAFLATTAFPPEEIAEARMSLARYLGELIARHREDPGDDLLSMLVRAHDVDGALSDTALVITGVGLLVAGYETTASQLTNIVYTLFAHPGRLEQLRADPGLLPAAIEELLRFVPLSAEAGMPRVATADVRLGGVLVKEGDIIYAARPAANRDEAAFPGGESLDFTREQPLPHLAFGHGMHHCLGAHLARMELQIALGGLLARFPGLRLAVPEERLRWKTGLFVRGLHELPVTW